MRSRRDGRVKARIFAFSRRNGAENELPMVEDEARQRRQSGPPDSRRRRLNDIVLRGISYRILTVLTRLCPCKLQSAIIYIYRRTKVYIVDDKGKHFRRAYTYETVPARHGRRTRGDEEKLREESAERNIRSRGPRKENKYQFHTNAAKCCPKVENGPCVEGSVIIPKVTYRNRLVSARTELAVHRVNADDRPRNSRDSY